MNANVNVMEKVEEYPDNSFHIVDASQGAYEEEVNSRDKAFRIYDIPDDLKYLANRMDRIETILDKISDIMLKSVQGNNGVQPSKPNPIVRDNFSEMYR